MMRDTKTSPDLYIIEESRGDRIFKRTLWLLSFIMTLFLIWALFTKVDEVANAPGEIIPLDYVKRVQHQDGGTIEHIFVRDGELVEKGAPLIQLNSELIDLQLDENKSQLEGLLSKLSLLSEQVGITEKLVDQGLSSKFSLLSLKGQQNDLEIRIIQSKETIKKLERMKKNTIIKAPLSGYIHNLQMHTIGGVISSEKTVLEIVPKDQKLIAEIKISSKDIGHVKTGKNVLLKLTTYDFGRHGGILGTLRDISPTTLLSPDGTPYYRGIVLLTKNYVGHNPKEHPIISGMTLTAEIKTGEKTVMQYLINPIYNSAKEALRER